MEVEHESKSANLTAYHPGTNKRATVKIDGVKRFHASGMMMQNVILDALIFESEVSCNYLDHCKKLLNLHTDTFDNNTLVFYIEPSVGIEIACSCGSVDVIEIRD